MQSLLCFSSHICEAGVWGKQVVENTGSHAMMYLVLNINRFVGPQVHARMDSLIPGSPRLTPLGLIHILQT